jgi:hypothetical protein
VSSLPRSDDSGCSLGKADFYESAVGAANAISCKNIVDANKFQEERKVIDGVVACLKASVWAHKENRYPWRPWLPCRRGVVISTEPPRQGEFLIQYRQKKAFCLNSQMIFLCASVSLW